MGRPREIPAGSLSDVPDPNAADPAEAAEVAEAFGWREPRPAHLVGMTTWGANPAIAAGYRGGPCPVGHGVLPGRTVCVICHATRTAQRGVPMQRIRAVRGSRSKGLKGGVGKAMA